MRPTPRRRTLLAVGLAAAVLAAVSLAGCSLGTAAGSDTGAGERPTGAAGGSGRTVDPRLLLVGDSVMLSLDYSRSLERNLTSLGWQPTLDAVQGRYSDKSIDALQTHLDDVGDVVVLQLGNNYDGDEVAYRAQLRRGLTMVSGVPEVVLLTVSEFRRRQQEVNEAIREVAPEYPNVRVLDWAAVTAADRTLTGADRLHLTTKGADALGRFIAAAIGTPRREAGRPPPIPLTPPAAEA